MERYIMQLMIKGVWQDVCQADGYTPFSYETKAEAEEMLQTCFGHWIKTGGQGRVILEGDA